MYLPSNAVVPPHVAAAQARLAEALHRLDCLQTAAVLGGEYDPDVYDAAVLDYRSARDALSVARRLLWSPFPLAAYYARVS